MIDRLRLCSTCCFCEVFAAQIDVSDIDFNDEESSPGQDDELLYTVITSYHNVLEQITATEHI